MNIFRYAFIELWKHKARTATSTLGYAVAVASIILIISMARSQNTGEIGVLKGVGTHFIAFIPENELCCEEQFDDGGPSAEGIYTEMLDSDILDTIRDLPGVKDAAPYLRFKLYHEEHRAFITIGGIDLTSDIDKISIATETSVCAEKHILQGRYLAVEDFDAIIIEQSFAQAANLSVNDTFNAFSRELKVVGLVNPGIRPAKADMYAPITVVREMVQQYAKKGLVGEVFMNIVLVEVEDARVQDATIESVQGVLHNATISSYKCYKPASSIISLSEKNVLTISVIIIVLAIVFAFKSQLASIVERRREIGILKSLGWSNSSLMGRIFTESVIQAVFGVLIGTGIAILLLSAVRWFNVDLGENIVVEVYYPAVVMAMVLGFLGGIFAGIFPTLKAGRLQPAEALRDSGGGI